MIDRELHSYLKHIAGYFPVVTLTGPRQLGKITLTRQVFNNHDAGSLLQERSLATVYPWHTLPEV